MNLENFDMSFCKQWLCGEKMLLETNKIRFVNVPRFDEFTVSTSDEFTIMISDDSVFIISTPPFQLIKDAGN